MTENEVCLGQVWSGRGATYDVARREVAYGVFSGQGDGAEHDEHQDEVGEDVVVGELVAEHTNPEGDAHGIEWHAVSVCVCVHLYACVCVCVHGHVCVCVCS